MIFRILSIVIVLGQQNPSRMAHEAQDAVEENAAEEEEEEQKEEPAKKKQKTIKQLEQTEDGEIVAADVSLMI
jgi:hypothetical protein